jgi:hypothetical protein
MPRRITAHPPHIAPSDAANWLAPAETRWNSPVVSLGPPG